MSYCVNCGVKLDDSLQKCPLCSTTVINPVSPYNPDAEKAWPTNEDNLSVKEDKHKIAGLISLTLGIIAVICTAVNLIYSPQSVYDHTKIWSLYVVGALTLIWTLIVPCLLINKARAIIYIGLDAIATSGFLWLVQWMTNGSWFLSLALPIYRNSCGNIMDCGYFNGICKNIKSIYSFNSSNVDRAFNDSA